VLSLTGKTQHIGVPVFKFPASTSRL